MDGHSGSCLQYVNILNRIIMERVIININGVSASLDLIPENIQWSNKVKDVAQDLAQKLEKRQMSEEEAQEFVIEFVSRWATDKGAASVCLEIAEYFAVRDDSDKQYWERILPILKQKVACCEHCAGCQQKIFS